MAGTTITINVDAEIVRKLRYLADREKVKKGFLGRVISAAIKEYLEEKERNETVEKALVLLKEGIDMGGMISKKRGDWHKR